MTVTLKDDVIAAVRVIPQATNDTSRNYQERFAAAIPGIVIGKRINEVQVDRRAGSSGTLAGFNAAIQRVKEQAASSR